MNTLDTREWLLTNGLGSFASGTVCDARTRTYHGWLIAALEPPGRRVLLLSHLEASLELGGQIWALGTNYWADKIDPWGYRLIRDFQVDPVPTWRWGADAWQLTRELVMPHGLSEETVPTPMPMSMPTLISRPIAPDEPMLCALPTHRLLVRYRYEGPEAAVLRLRPLIADRDFHHPQQQDPQLSFSQLVGANHLLLQAMRVGRAETPWQLRWTQGNYYPDEVWYWNFYYPEEADRGLDALEDLYSPGYLGVRLQPGETVTLEARVGFPTADQTRLVSDSFDRALQQEQVRLPQAVPLLQAAQEAGHQEAEHQKSFGQQTFRQLLSASDRFVAYQSTPSEPRLIAGYHWFGDRSRETLLCLPGFALTTKRFDLARKLLDRMGRLCCQGLIPNVIPDSGADPVFRSLDCSLWWIETLGLYLKATQDWGFLTEQYSVVKQIYKSFTAGTLHNIRVDASDGLLTWDDQQVALTWMDTTVNGVPVTPRHGKPIEINALWYSALCWAGEWATRLAEDAAPAEAERLQNQARRYTQQANQVRQSLQKFWNARLGYLYDRIEPDDRLDATIRPNAMLALALHQCAFREEQAQQILQMARDRLLTPYGLRSLDPADPNYVGCYRGTPHQRDFAAHQGTVWSWLLGPFIRAWTRFEQTPLPIDFQPLLTHFGQQVGFYAISELFDGDEPYVPRGTIAHASPIAELLREWHVWGPLSESSSATPSSISPSSTSPSSISPSSTSPSSISPSSTSQSSTS